MTYAEATVELTRRQRELSNLLRTTPAPTNNDLIRARGRVIAMMQVQIKAAANEGLPANHLKNRLNVELQEHKKCLAAANKDNKHGQYSIIKEMSLGMKTLINSVRTYANASTPDGKKEAGKDILKSVGLNLKNTLKAPVVMATRILSTSLVVNVLFAPISIGMGILHAAWTCLDSKPSPYDNSGVKKMSQGFQKVVTNIKGKVQTI